MRIPAIIADFIEFRLPDHPSLEGVQICIDGETQTASPPLIVIDETGSTRTEQAGVPIHGVSTVSVSVQLHTVPADDATTADDAQAMSDDLYDIIADIDGMRQYCDGRRSTRVLDIFADAAIIAAEDGRRISTVTLEILAHPI